MYEYSVTSEELQKYSLHYPNEAPSTHTFPGYLICRIAYRGRIGKFANFKKCIYTYVHTSMYEYMHAKTFITNFCISCA